jgi:L-gulonolactone oxidase
MTPSSVEHPSSTAEVADAVRRRGRSGLRVKAVGSGHSFTGVALTDGVLPRPAPARRLVSVDAGTCRVEVQAGMPLHRLNAVLASTASA